MSKRTRFTTVTPLPSTVSRLVVMETLRSHTEMIDLNPLVEERHPIKPPPEATAEEYHCQWYSLTDRVQYLPGNVLSGKISYNVCFHDLESGVQTHCYAPLGLNIRGKWTLGGNLQGEPAAPVELGSNTPRTGLWLREDVDMKCNIMMTSFVKKTLVKSHAALVGRLVVKAQMAAEREKSDAISAHFSGSQSSTDYSPASLYSQSSAWDSRPHSPSQELPRLSTAAPILSQVPQHLNKQAQCLNPRRMSQPVIPRSDFGPCFSATPTMRDSVQSSTSFRSSTSSWLPESGPSQLAPRPQGRPVSSFGAYAHPYAPALDVPQPLRPRPASTFASCLHTPSQLTPRPQSRPSSSFHECATPRPLPSNPVHKTRPRSIALSSHPLPSRAARETAAEPIPNQLEIGYRPRHCHLVTAPGSSALGLRRHDSLGLGQYGGQRASELGKTSDGSTDLE